MERSRGALAGVISEVSSPESLRDLLELEGVELSSASGTDWLELLDEREKDDGNVAGGLMGWADSTGIEVVEVDVDIASVAAASLEDWVIAVAGSALRSIICFCSPEVGSGLSCLTE